MTTLKLAFAFFFSLFTEVLFCQTQNEVPPKIRALLEAVEKAESPRQKWTALGNVLKEPAFGDRLERLKVAEQALQVAREIPANDLIMKGLSNLGQIAGEAGEADKAERAFLEAIELAQKTGNRHQEYRAARGRAALYQEQEPTKCLALIEPFWQRLEKETADSLDRMKVLYLNAMVPALQWVNRKSDAAAIALKGLALSEKAKDASLEWAFTTQLANIYSETEDFASALVYGKKALALLKPGDPNSPGAWNVIANVYKCLDSLETAKMFSQKTLAWPNVSVSRKATALNQLAEIAVKEGRFMEALRQADAAEKVLQGSNDDRGRARIWQIQGRALTGAGRCAEAVKKLEKSKNYYFAQPEQAYRFERLNAEGLYLKARLCAEGRDSLAKDFDAFVNSTDTVHDHRLRAEVEELRHKYEAAEKERTIAQQTAEIGRKSLLQKFLLAFLLLGLVAAGLGWRLFWAKKRENERIKADWEDLKAENRQLLDDLDAAKNQPMPIAELAVRTILFGENGEKVQLAFGDILFADVVKSGAAFHTTDGKIHYSRYSLAHWLKALPPALFVRLHNSHAVNRLHVRAFTATGATLSNGKNLSIGRAYKEAALAELGKPMG